MQFDKQIFSLEQIDILLQQFRHTIQQLLHASTPLADLEPVRRYEKSLLLGINKKSFSQAGGALIGMDSDDPAQRLSTILAEVSASTIIVSPSCLERVNAKVTAKNTVIVDMERI
ncbi:MAG: hypothetical protein LQ337_006979 [Flavoplaca oasis]|nr:MAG: hypothetical protein LQ337_006979 [Flavoplaca oasis]